MARYDNVILRPGIEDLYHESKKMAEEAKLPAHMIEHASLLCSIRARAIDSAHIKSESETREEVKDYVQGWIKDHSA